MLFLNIGIFGHGGDGSLPAAMHAKLASAEVPGVGQLAHQEGVTPSTESPLAKNSKKSQCIEGFSALFEKDAVAQANDPRVVRPDAIGQKNAEETDLPKVAAENRDPTGSERQPLEPAAELSAQNGRDSRAISSDLEVDGKFTTHHEEDRGSENSSEPAASPEILSAVKSRKDLVSSGFRGIPREINMVREEPNRGSRQPDTLVVTHAAGLDTRDEPSFTVGQRENDVAHLAPQVLEESRAPAFGGDTPPSPENGGPDLRSSRQDAAQQDAEGSARNIGRDPSEVPPAAPASSEARRQELSPGPSIEAGPATLNASSASRIPGEAPEKRSLEGDPGSAHPSFSRPTARSTQSAGSPVEQGDWPFMAAAFDHGVPHRPVTISGWRAPAADRTRAAEETTTPAPFDRSAQVSPEADLAATGIRREATADHAMRSSFPVGQPDLSRYGALPDRADKAPEILNSQVKNPQTPYATFSVATGVVSPPLTRPDGSGDARAVDMPPRSGGLDQRNDLQAFQDQTRAIEATPSPRTGAPHGQEARQAELARSIAVQIAQHAQPGGGSVVELQLSPEELGSVKFLMSLSESGLNIVVQADRPETQELMRRHLDQLQAHFLSLGFGETSISFGGGQSDAPSGHDRDADAVATPSVDDEGGQFRETRAPTGIGIDIRI